MAYSLEMAGRIESFFDSNGIRSEQKKMMGGVVFMVDDKMCVGLNTDKEKKTERIMVRLDKERHEDYLAKTGCEAMMMTGKLMPGFYFIFPEGYESGDGLDYWLSEALAFNPKAPASKKKKKG